ncbi:hypothetical protein [Nitrososphaera sp.]|uniref:hypothetical protein n=1 Tax=Nitrososphaera sp. TaxID=1971748 RepID=UPI00317345F1
MLEEAITIAIIIGGSATAVWYAKKKFQPEIESSLDRLESRAVVEEYVRKKHDDLR